MTLTMKISIFWDVVYLPDCMVSPQKRLLFVVSTLRTLNNALEYGYKNSVVRICMLLPRALLY